MELTHLVKIVTRRWALALAAFLVVLALGAAAAFLPAERYTGTSTLLVQPLQGTADFGQVQLVEFLIPSLTRQVESEPFRETVDRSLPPSAQSVDYTVTAGREPGTGILEISIESTQRAAVATIANRYAETLVENHAATETLAISVIAPAVDPSSPSAPAKTIILLGAGALGLLAAVFVPLAEHALRRRLGDAEEIRRRFGTSTLGELPRLPRKSRGQTINQIVSNSSDPAVIEAFHRLRTNVELSLLGDEPPAVAVISLHTGEGKSIVAAALGTLLAGAGNRITLIDADLRRPTLHQYLGEPFGAGLAGASRSARTPGGTAAMVPTSTRNLDFVPAGLPDRHPAEVITMALPPLLNDLQRARRMVLVDCPPLNGVAESNIIAAMTGAIVLVVDARRYDERALEEALYQLHEAKVRVLGVVINRVKLSRAQRQMSEYYSARPYGRADDDRGRELPPS